jgi:hypothetical protein
MFRFFENGLYHNCQNIVPIDLASPSSVIASESKQSIRLSKGLLRRQAPGNDGLSEQIFDNRYINICAPASYNACKAHLIFPIEPQNKG